jgi:hypothetical protein
MSTLPTNLTGVVQATGVRFEGDRLTVRLSDGREVSIPLSQVHWLNWLAKATPEQRAHWSIEPEGFAVYWEDLDDGFEIAHWLAIQSLN